MHMNKEDATNYKEKEQILSFLGGFVLFLHILDIILFIAGICVYRKTNNIEYLQYFFVAGFANSSITGFFTLLSIICSGSILCWYKNESRCNEVESVYKSA